MSPALLTILLSLVEELVKIEPEIAAQLKAIFAKETATPEDWQAVKDAVLSKRYRDLVPDTQIP